MEPVPVSVVVVSRARPRWLARCLTGIAQLDHRPFEVVVVACPAGCEAVRAHPKADEIKLVAYDQDNISAARNRGIAAAAGEIVAFIDDDAVPEPSWLSRLTAPFEHEEVAAVGGYVIGRNGFSLQWGAGSVDASGERCALSLEGEEPVTLHPQDGRAIKTEGTNMAVRRSLLAEMGGFDPAFRFYLDETDLNLRLAARDHATALAPMARVHHGVAESARRAADRTPRDLHEIGASKMVFLRKHVAPDEHKRALARFRAEQKSRLLRAMRDGPLDAGDVFRIMRSLDAGIAAGAGRDLPRMSALPAASEGFRPFTARPGAKHRIHAGRSWVRQRLEDEARAAVIAGETATVLSLSPTALYHTLRFGEDGIWRQIGGQYGRAERSGPLFRLATLKRRIALEGRRLSKFRNV